MRRTISALIAAMAVVTASAAPALACGFGQACVPQVYVAPVCTTGCGGWGHDRLPDPVLQYHSAPRVHQYYYVNQGPTYTGPGAFAPFPTYQESAVSGWGAYRQRPYYYGYDGGRYADANTHYYDGVGLEGPRVYSYRAQARFRAGSRHRHGVPVLRRYY